MKSKKMISGVFRFLLLVTVFFVVSAATTSAQSDSLRSPSMATETSADGSLTLVETDSPRMTYRSLLRLNDALETALAEYFDNQSTEGADEIFRLINKIQSLIDLSELPQAARRECGTETALHLLDIFGRIEPIDPETLPGGDGFDPKADSAYRFPNTPIRIVRIGEDARRDEFLFSADMVREAPLFLAEIEDLPLRSRIGTESWSVTGRQLAGPWIPANWAQNMPVMWTGEVLDTPLWKIILMAFLSAATIVALRLFHRLLYHFGKGDTVRCIRLSILSPAAVMATALWLEYVLTRQINAAGRFFLLADACLVIAFYVAAIVAFWLLCRILFQTILVDPRVAGQELDQKFLRLVGQILGAMGAVVLIGFGVYELGVPVMSIAAGLGIGGIAVALAIRPSLENLIGGVILFIDQPIRVGDFCTFGDGRRRDEGGKVVSIGIRSTQLRALDRTLISIPNAQFADLKIVNWAKCDMMQIHETLGLRYETDAEQLRHVLAKMREMLHAHPRIDSDTVRVRFIRYGASSLDIDLRIYAKTREWNDWFAIREDVMLRLKDIVEASGTGFAFPSQTLYWGRDSGLDEDLAKQAREEVAEWRRRRQLPFPNFSDERLTTMADGLRYPPPGSPDFFATDEELSEGGETLSAPGPTEGEKP